MNKYWEDDFNWDDYNDYKSAYVERERLRQQNSTNGWIYIGIDTRYNNTAKIGLTTGELGTRASGSQNPFYALLCAFKIKEGVTPQKITEIESATIDFLSKNYKRISHVTSGRPSGRPSEWFYATPAEMRELVHDYLYDNYSWEMYSYHCSERDIGVIYSWENTQLLAGTSRTPYRADDLSSPPVDPACFMPGGCGEECDCWE